MGSVLYRHVFVMSSTLLFFGVSARLCFVIMAFPEYLNIFLQHHWKCRSNQRSEYDLLKFWKHGINESALFRISSKTTWPRQTKRCLRTRAKLAFTPVCTWAVSSGPLLSTETFYTIQRFCLRTGSSWSDCEDTRRHVFAWRGISRFI